MANIKDVAKKAGVSISTVSNVINGTKYVSGELRNRVNLAIEKLDYVVDPVARSLKSKKTMSIGVVITNINRVFFSQVLKGIQDEVEKKGYKLTFCDTDDKFTMERQFMNMLRNNWVDGIILDSVADMDQADYFSELSEFGVGRKRIPIVSLERRFDQYNIDSVVVDNHMGGRLAARHLIEEGCTDFVHIKGPRNSCMVFERFEGFKDELEAHDFRLGENNTAEGDFSPLSGYKAIKSFIDKGISFNGVFAANDQMAIGAIKAIREHGLDIPGDVKIVGFDNSFIASIVEPSLTTIDVPKYNMGKVAVKMLIRRIENNTLAARNEELPISLIVRQSTSLKGDKSWDLCGW